MVTRRDMLRKIDNELAYLGTQLTEEMNGKVRSRLRELGIEYSNVGTFISITNSFGYPKGKYTGSENVYIYFGRQGTPIDPNIDEFSIEYRKEGHREKLEFDDSSGLISFLDEAYPKNQ